MLVNSRLQRSRNAGKSVGRVDVNSKGDLNQILELWAGLEVYCRSQYTRAKARSTLESLVFLGPDCLLEYQNTALALRLLPCTASEVLSRALECRVLRILQSGFSICPAAEKVWLFPKWAFPWSLVYYRRMCDVVELSCGGPNLDAVSAVPPPSPVTLYTRTTRYSVLRDKCDNRHGCSLGQKMSTGRSPPNSPMPRPGQVRKTRASHARSPTPSRVGE